MKTTGYNSAKSWGIAGACSIVNCFLTFPTRIVAILFVEFVDRYNTDRQTVSLFVIVNGMTRSIIAPFVGYLGEIIELRYLTVMGCCIASIGVGACYFATNILNLTLFLGLIYGAGYSLANTLIIQIIKQHFNKNFANANGILHAGNSIGALSTVPIFSVLLKQYDVLGALLIVSALMAHGVPIAMLLRDPKYKNASPSSKTTLSKKFHHQRDSQETLQGNKNCLTTYTKKESIPSAPATLIHVQLNKYHTSEKPILINFQSKETMECQEQPLASISFQSLSSSKLEENIDSKSNHTLDNDKKQIKLLQRISVSAFEKKSKFGTYFKILLVFKNIPFIMILICESIRTYAEVFILTTVVDIARDNGVDRSQEHFFPMLMPIAETAGFLGLGWVTDMGYLSITNYMGIGFLCMAVSCFCLVMTKHFLTMMIAAIGFSLFSSGITIGTPVLIYEFVEESKHNMAIASKALLYAPLSFTIAPMIGYFKDTFGSYNGAIYLLSAVCTGSALLVSSLPCIVRCRNKKK